MYYFKMKIAVKSDLKSKTFATAKSFYNLKEKEVSFVDSKFYQKLFIVLISMCTILIFPESPRELENICENYYSIKSCNVW